MPDVPRVPQAARRPTSALSLKCGAPRGHALPMLNVLVVIVVVGFLLWLANTLIPMEPRVK